MSHHGDPAFLPLALDERRELLHQLNLLRFSPNDACGVDLIPEDGIVRSAVYRIAADADAPELMAMCDDSDAAAFYAVVPDALRRALMTIELLEGELRGLLSATRRLGSAADTAAHTLHRLADLRPRVTCPECGEAHPLVCPSCADDSTSAHDE
jgi:hypothetical protein